MQDRLGELFKSSDKDTTQNGEVRMDVLGGGEETYGGERKEDGVQQSLTYYEQVKQLTDRIRENSAEVKELKLKSNKECAGDAQKAIFDNLDRTMQRTQKLAKEAKRVLQEGQEDIGVYERDHPNAPSLIFRKNMLSTASRQLNTSLEAFTQSSEDFKRALSEKITRQARIVNPAISDEEIDLLIESKDPQAFMKDQMMGPSAQLVERVAEIEERHEGILRIEEGVKQIQELFNDLAFLVDVQGEKLQNIEENVLQTSSYTQQATVELKKAEVSAKKARKKQCYIILCCLIILIVILAPTLVSVLPNA